MTAWTKKKEAEFERLDRKVLNGKATRKEVERAIDLKRERAAAKEASTRTIGDLEKAAGITDRDAFWMQFSHITGTIRRGHLRLDKGLEAGIAELRRMAAENEARV